MGLWHKHTVPSSGIEIEYRRLGFELINEWLEAWDRENPRPAVPVATIDGEQHENPIDPSYLDRLDAWKRAKTRAINEETARSAIRPLVSDEEITATVAELRAINAEARIKLDMDGPDKTLYLRHVVFVTLEDWADVVRLIEGKTFVRPEAVATAKDAMFPGNAAGAGHLGTADAHE